MYVCGGISIVLRSGAQTSGMASEQERKYLHIFVLPQQYIVRTFQCMMEQVLLVL
jgi:hypothetical protein